MTVEENKLILKDEIARINERRDKLKDFLVKYLTMGNEFALGSLKAALKNV